MPPLEFRHVAARGNRREPIFFEDGDQDIYCDMLAEQAIKTGVEVWAYCLMLNHVHLILCPKTEDGMARPWALPIGAGQFSSTRGRWRGHLFDGRFASLAMDEDHLMAAVRYVALNPVRARLAPTAEAWPWSSARAHLKGVDDGLVTVRPVLERFPQFAEPIAVEGDETGFAALRAAESTGRPLGTPDFITGLERVLGRRIARRAPGRKPKDRAEDQPQLL